MKQAEAILSVSYLPYCYFCGALPTKGRYGVFSESPYLCLWSLLTCRCLDHRGWLVRLGTASWSWPDREPHSGGALAQLSCEALIRAEVFSLLTQYNLVKFRAQSVSLVGLWPEHVSWVMFIDRYQWLHISERDMDRMWENGPLGTHR